MTHNLFGRTVKVTIDNGTYKGTFSNDDFTIHFFIPFDDDTVPNESTISLYNLTQSTRNKLTKNASITVSAGYKSDGYGVLLSGKIGKVRTSREGVDDVTTIHVTEGVDYAEINVKKKITFKKGVYGQQILSRLARELGVSFAVLDLPNNKRYSKGYTVEDSIINKMEEVAKDCGAVIYWRRGRLVCRSIKTGDDERFTLEENTGLLDTPEYWEDDIGKGWNIHSLLQYRMTTASIIQLKSREVSGSFRIKSGSHNFDGTTFTTEAVVIYT